MVPETNPREALDMFSRFIQGLSLTHHPSAATTSSSSITRAGITSSKEKGQGRAEAAKVATF